MGMLKCDLNSEGGLKAWFHCVYSIVKIVIQKFQVDLHYVNVMCKIIACLLFTVHCRFHTQVYPAV